MSKDIKLIKECLIKITNGDLSHNLDTALLNKKNDVGAVARLVQQIIENERENSKMLEKISQGDFSAAISNNKPVNDKKKVSINKIAEVLNQLNCDFESLYNDTLNGEACLKIEENKYPGGFRTLVEAANNSINTVISPIIESSQVISNMAVNNFTQGIIGDYSGIFKEYTDNINSLLDRFKAIESTLVKLSKGDTSDAEYYRKIGKRSDEDKLIPSLIQINETIGDLIEELDSVSLMCEKGDLKNARGNEDKFEGNYKKIVEGINKVTDSISKSFMDITRAMTAISVNDLTVDLEEEYSGDFKEMANSIRKMRNNLVLIQNELEKISKGDISNIEEVKSLGSLSENDHIIPALTTLMDIIKTLIDGIAQMGTEVEGGDLLYRIDDTNMEGEFANIVNGINNSFDLMANPLMEIAASLESLAVGNTHTLVTGTYNGIFESLAADANKIMNRIQTIILKITEVLTQVASGNLNIEQLDQLEGEWNGVPTALNNIIDSLNALVGNIYSAVDQVAAGAVQVSMGSQELSRGATVQASSVEQLTASITEIASQTKENAQNAGQASILAKDMRESALSGNNEMKEMLTSMEEINESSRSISKIIKVIDDIAFQTNILALNAAVEAARAGQHGKGFAVVAEEVRNLAARSAKAANETTSLIEGSINKVGKGTQIAKDTAKTLNSIVDGVDKVANLVENIAVASNEQATGIAQVNQGLEQVSKVVQTNSATAEQSAAASEELSGQANILKGSVEKFTLRAGNIKLNSEESNISYDEKSEDQKSTDSKPKIELAGDYGKY